MSTLKPIRILFNKGIQSPATLGSLKLRLTAEGAMAYAQNIDNASDEYGYGVIVPGPALVTIDNNSELVGVPYISALFTFLSGEIGYRYFAEGLLGSSWKIRRIKDLEPTETPSIDTTGSITIDHNSHVNPVVTDMVFRETSGSYYIYVIGYDNTDGWVQKFIASAGSPTLAAVTTLTGLNAPNIDAHAMLGPDNNIYVGFANHIDSIDVSDVRTIDKLALGLPVGVGVVDLCSWNDLMAIAYSSDFGFRFSSRLAAGNSGIILWDYVSPSITKKPISAPCKYISAIVNDPSGNLLVFGGVDEGKSTIYLFTGYGFQPLFTYIGDLPRSKHSITFDSLGRVLWLTADGQWCRYDRASNIFEHLGSITTGSSAGGLLVKGVAGSEYLLASGSGSTYALKRAVLGSYIGDDASASDTVTTPLGVSGTEILPQGSNIQAITLNLVRRLLVGEKVELRIYKNGSTDYEVYLTMDYSSDGAISSKREALTKDNIDNFSLAVAWKMADAATTAPPVAFADVELGSQY